MTCAHALASGLTNEEPDEVGVMLGEEVIEVHKAGEGAFIVLGGVALHGYRQVIRGLGGQLQHQHGSTAEVRSRARVSAAVLQQSGLLCDHHSTTGSW